MSEYTITAELMCGSAQGLRRAIDAENCAAFRRATERLALARAEGRTTDAEGWERLLAAWVAEGKHA